MSHKVTVKTQVKDVCIAIAAASALGLRPTSGEHTVELFSGRVRCNFSVKLPGWEYPIAVDTRSGECHFDNYNGKWGDVERLRDFVQEYTLQVAEAEAAELEMRGYTLARVQQENGDIQLQITQGI